jgi:hypothetical protein
LGEIESDTRLGSNTQLYAQENADAANFIIIIIIKERCGREQGVEATHHSHHHTHSNQQIINQ